MSSLYPQNLNFSPARNIPSPHLRPNPDAESQYLTEMLAERQKLGPFMQVLPICSRLLDQAQWIHNLLRKNKITYIAALITVMAGVGVSTWTAVLSVYAEILRLSGRISNHGFNDYERLQRGSPNPVSSLDVMPDVGGKSLGNWNGNSWNSMQHEQRLGGPQSMTIDWKPPGSPSSFLVKRVLRLDIPVERYPNFNFVGRLLGPRGNSLKRVEASTGCRVFIRGKGSIKDADKEESLRGKPGYEHLNEPLHILIEAEAAEVPASVVDVRLKQAKDIIEELLKPVDESQDMYKRQQLRELAMLNNIKEDSPQPRGSVSPFNSSGLKRPKTSW